MSPTLGLAKVTAWIGRPCALISPGLREPDKTRFVRAHRTDWPANRPEFFAPRPLLKRVFESPDSRQHCDDPGILCSQQRKEALFRHVDPLLPALKNLSDDGANGGEKKREKHP